MLIPEVQIAHNVSEDDRKFMLQALIPYSLNHRLNIASATLELEKREIVTAALMDWLERNGVTS